MHDPLTIAFEIRRPWPQTADWRTKQAARDGIRWRIGDPYWVLAGRGLYFPGLITIWHCDPSGYDDTTCPTYPGNAWRMHVHHWRIQLHPYQRLRRRLLTRCTWCGGPSVKGDTVNVSHQWDGPRERWWQGEKGLFHVDCSAIKTAHATCVCDQPVLEHDDYGQCARCNRSRPFGMTDENLARTRELSAIPDGGRQAKEAQ
jgi:hypothetical protein